MSQQQPRSPKQWQQKRQMLAIKAGKLREFAEPRKAKTCNQRGATHILCTYYMILEIAVAIRFGESRFLCWIKQAHVASSQIPPEKNHDHPIILQSFRWYLALKTTHAIQDHKTAGETTLFVWKQGTRAPAILFSGSKLQNLIWLVV